jgi:hypothetical protein
VLVIPREENAGDVVETSFLIEKTSLKPTSVHTALTYMIYA